MSVNPDTLMAFINETGRDFNLVYPGLTGQPGTVSLELAILPGTYLRHKSMNIRLENSSMPADPGVVLCCLVMLR